MIRLKLRNNADTKLNIIEQLLTIPQTSEII